MEGGGWRKCDTHLLDSSILYLPSSIFALTIFLRVSVSPWFNPPFHHHHRGPPANGSTSQRARHDRLLRMDMLLAVCAGVALAAACGFRVFLPLLGLSLGAAAGWLKPGEGMEWVGSGPAIATLSVAAAMEVGGYYIPVVDHLLDTIASPAAVVAGTVATAALLPGGDQLHPVVKWAAAPGAGGGGAGGGAAGAAAAGAGAGATPGAMGHPVGVTLTDHCGTGWGGRAGLWAADPPAVGGAC